MHYTTKEVKMNKKALLLTCCLCALLAAAGSCPAANPLTHAPTKTDHPGLGKVPHIPRVTRLPDLTITRIYSKKHRGVLGVWADIKNNGGPIPEKEFNQADMRFYLSYMNTGSPTTGPVKGRKENGYSFKYLEQKGAGILSKAGGKMSVIAPGDLTCHGVVRVRVEVDLPISGNGRIRESNEHNNVKTVTLHCP